MGNEVLLYIKYADTLLQRQIK